MTEIAAVISRIRSTEAGIAATRQITGTDFARLLNQAMSTAQASTGLSPVPGNPVTIAGLDQALALGQVGTSTGSQLMMPVQGDPGSGFGMRIHPITGVERMHEGIDISAPSGTPIRAAAGSKVSYAGVMGGYGNVVIVDHGNGMQTLYAHQSSLSVKVGDVVSAGQTIGAVGSTGLSTGPHLHFEVRIDGEQVDPAPYLGL